jgi:hypothetical protein
MTYAKMLKEVGDIWNSFLSSTGETMNLREE